MTNDEPTILRRKTPETEATSGVVVRVCAEGSWSCQVQFEDPRPSPSQTLCRLLGEEITPRNFDVPVLAVEGCEAKA